MDAGMTVPCRWTIDSASAGADTRLHDAARHLGAEGLEVQREPREANLRVDAKDVGQVSRRMPWVDPAIFFQRSTRSPGSTPSSIALIAPSDPVDPTLLGPLVRAWRTYANARGAVITVIGREGRTLGIPRAPHWLRGGSAVELATLLRQSDLVVQLSQEWTEELVGALLVGTPVALRDEASDDAPLPRGWRMASTDAGT